MIDKKGTKPMSSTVFLWPKPLLRNLYETDWHFVVPLHWHFVVFTYLPKYSQNKISLKSKSHGNHKMCHKSIFHCMSSTENILQYMTGVL